jgi:hypothetical protein
VLLELLHRYCSGYPATIARYQWQHLDPLPQTAPCRKYPRPRTQSKHRPAPPLQKTGVQKQERKDSFSFLPLEQQQKQVILKM